MWQNLRYFLHGTKRDRPSVIHSAPQFLPNSDSIACLVAELQMFLDIKFFMSNHILIIIKLLKYACLYLIIFIKKENK